MRSRRISTSKYAVEVEYFASFGAAALCFLGYGVRELIDASPRRNCFGLLAALVGFSAPMWADARHWWPRKRN
jgi:hypothetical protein